MRGVYGIRCRVNGRLYVGSSIHMRHRWNGHRSALRRGRHGNPALQADWNAYGEASFSFEILERVPTANLDLREEMHIDLNAPILYNVHRFVSSARTKRGIDYVPAEAQSYLDSGIFWTWAADEINVEWERDGKIVYWSRDIDPGVFAQYERDWRSAVAARAEQLRWSRVDRN